MEKNNVNLKIFIEQVSDLTGFIKACHNNIFDKLSPTIAEKLVFLSGEVSNKFHNMNYVQEKS